MAEYIEREALLKWAREFYPNNLQFASAVINAPAADVAEVIHGKNITQINPVDEFICSECGFRCGDYSEVKYEEDGDYEYSCECVFDYCPRCGAKMDGSEEE